MVVRLLARNSDHRDVKKTLPTSGSVKLTKWVKRSDRRVSAELRETRHCDRAGSDLAPLRARRECVAPDVEAQVRKRLRWLNLNAGLLDELSFDKVGPLLVEMGGAPAMAILDRLEEVALEVVDPHAWIEKAAARASQDGRERGEDGKQHRARKRGRQSDEGGSELGTRLKKRSSSPDVDSRLKAYPHCSTERDNEATSVRGRLQCKAKSGQDTNAWVRAAMRRSRDSDVEDDHDYPHRADEEASEQADRGDRLRVKEEALEQHAPDSSYAEDVERGGRHSSREDARRDLQARLKKRISRMNNKNAGPRCELPHDEVRPPPDPRERRETVAVLKKLKESEDSAEDANVWVAAEVGRSLVSSNVEALRSGCPFGHPDDMDVETRVRKRVGWMNKNLRLQDELRVDRAGPSLVSLGSREAMRILKKLEDSADTVKDPNAWVISAARRAADGASSDAAHVVQCYERGDAPNELDAKVKKRIDWMNNNVLLQGELHLSRVGPALLPLGQGGAMLILRKLEESADKVKDPNAWVVTAAWRAVQDNDVKLTPCSDLALDEEEAHDLQAKVKKRIGWMNNNLWLQGKLCKDKVSPALVSLGQGKSMLILKKLEEHADTVKDPNAWVIAAARRAADVEGGREVSEPFGRREPADDALDSDTKVQKRISWMNNNLRLQGELCHDRVGHALVSVGQDEAMLILKKLEESADTVKDPNAWVTSAARRARDITEIEVSEHLSCRDPVEDSGDLDAKVKKRIGWMNKNVCLKGELVFDRVGPALVSSGQRSAMLILKKLEESANTVKDPNAWVVTAARRAGDVNDMEDSGLVNLRDPGNDSQDVEATVKKRIDWMNNNLWLQCELCFDRVGPALVSLEEAEAMLILKKLEESAAAVKDPNAWVIAAAWRAMDVNDMEDSKAPSSRGPAEEARHLDAKLKKRIGWMNNNLFLQGELVFDRVGPALMSLEQSAAMLILKKLEESADTVKDPNAWVITAARRQADFIDMGASGHRNFRDPGGDPLDLDTRVKKRIGWMNNNLRLQCELFYDRVGPALVCLGQAEAMLILKRLEESVDSIQDPNAWVITAARRAMEVKDIENAEPLSSRDSADDPQDVTTKVKKRISWMNNNLWLQGELIFDRVGPALTSLGKSGAMLILKKLEDSADTVNDPNAWVITGARREADVHDTEVPELVHLTESADIFYDLDAKVRKRVDWMNENLLLQGELMFDRVGPALVSLGQTAAMLILKKLEGSADTVKDPTAWVIAAARREADVDDAEEFEHISLREFADDPLDLGTKVRKRIGWMNKHLRLQSELSVDVVGRALVSLGQGEAMLILKKLENSADTVVDPNSWVMAAARRMACENMQHFEVARSGEPSNDPMDLDAKVKKRIGWMNNNLRLQGELSYDRVGPALVSLGQSEAMLILKKLEDSADTVKDPSAWVATAVRRASESKDVEFSGAATSVEHRSDSHDVETKVKKRIAWMNKHASLHHDLLYDRVGAGLLSAGLNQAMIILRKLEESADAVNDPNAWVAAAARRATDAVSAEVDLDLESCSTDPEEGPQRVEASLKKRVAWMNSNAGLNEDIVYIKVAPLLISLGSRKAMAILERLQQTADCVGDPTAWLLAMARRSLDGHKAEEAERASYQREAERSSYRVGQQDDPKDAETKVKRRLAWMNRNLWLHDDLIYNKVGPPLISLGGGPAMAILKVLEAGADEIRDPNAWLLAAARRTESGQELERANLSDNDDARRNSTRPLAIARRSASGQEPDCDYFGYQPSDDEDADAEAKLERRVAWMNRNLQLQEKLTFSKVGPSLLTLDYLRAMALLRRLERGAESIRDPGAWLLAAVSADLDGEGDTLEYASRTPRRDASPSGMNRSRSTSRGPLSRKHGLGQVLAEQAPGTEVRPDSGRRLERRVGWLNSHGRLRSRLNFNEVCPLLTKLGEPNAMDILQRLEESAASVHDPTGWVQAAARRAAGNRDPRVHSGTEARDLESGTNASGLAERHLSGGASSASMVSPGRQPAGSPSRRAPAGSGLVGGPRRRSVGRSWWRRGLGSASTSPQRRSQQRRSRSREAPRLTSMTEAKLRKRIEWLNSQTANASKLRYEAVSGALLALGWQGAMGVLQRLEEGAAGDNDPEDWVIAAAQCAGYGQASVDEGDGGNDCLPDTRLTSMRKRWSEGPKPDKRPAGVRY